MTTWQRVGLAWLLIIVLFFVIRFAQGWVREFTRQLQQKKMCDDRCCDYYHEYLQKGPPDLTHSQYHEAVNALRYWEESMKRWEDSERSIPFYSSKMVELYRMQSRL